MNLWLKRMIFRIKEFIKYEPYKIRREYHFQKWEFYFKRLMKEEKYLDETTIRD